MKNLTLDWLENRKIRTDLLHALKSRFGSKATIKEVVDYLHEIKEPHWENLLLGETPYLTIAMIKAGTDIHAGDDYPLRWAANNGHFNVVKYLVEHGADIHARNDAALILAAANGHLSIVKYLVKSGADIHAYYNCALRSAAEDGHFSVVKYLVKSGAGIHDRNNEALCSARFYNHGRIVRFLEKQS